MKKMKKLRKLVSIMLTLIMVIAMAAPTFAESTITIEGTGDDGLLKGHTFHAYQIFDGIQGEDGVLLNVTWADEVAGSALLSALQESKDASLIEGEKNIFADCKRAADVAKVLGEYSNDSDVAKAFAKIAYEHKGSTMITLSTTIPTTVPVGYYLIVDETSIEDGKEDKVRNAALLQVTGAGDFEVKVKTEKPTVDKKVKEINDSTGVEPVWQDGADYDLGDSVKFQLTGTLPNNFIEYETYYYKFTDTLSSGLTLNAKADFTVKAMNGDAVSKTFNEGDYTKKVEGSEITIEFTDLTDFDWGNSLPTSIVIEYEAILNENAVSGAPGNINEVDLEYSNNPNGGGTGKTPDNKVIVFTYDIVAKKVDGDKEPLAGAIFTLYKWDAKEEKWGIVGTENEGTEGGDPNNTKNIYKFEKNDTGKYKLVETTTPDGYNTADDLEFEIVGIYDTEKKDGKAVSELTGLEIQNARYVDKSGETIGDPINIEGTFIISSDKSTISTDIVNNKGALLPETGGIGTTIFYVLGSVLILGAGVLLITKKKMGSRE